MLLFLSSVIRLKRCHDKATAFLWVTIGGGVSLHLPLRISKNHDFNALDFTDFAYHRCYVQPSCIKSIVLWLTIWSRWLKLRAALPVIVTDPSDCCLHCIILRAETDPISETSLSLTETSSIITNSVQDVFHYRGCFFSQTKLLYH
jgi:hypothetical protein